MAVTTQPVSQAVAIGSFVELTAAYTMDGYPTPQWQAPASRRAIAVWWEVYGEDDWVVIEGSTDLASAVNGTRTSTFLAESGYDYRCTFWVETFLDDEENGVWSGTIDAAISTNVATISVAEIPMWSTVDDGFEGRSNDASLDSSIWSTTTTPTGLYKTCPTGRTGICALIAGTGATEGYAENQSDGMTEDGSEIRWRAYFDNTTGRRDMLDNASVRCFTLDWGADGKLNVRVDQPNNPNGYTTGSYTEVGTYVAGWTEYRLVFDFAAQTYTLESRTTENGAWTQHKAAGATGYAIPFRSNSSSAVVSQSNGCWFRGYAGVNHYVDDLRYQDGGFTTEYAEVPSFSAHPSDSGLLYEGDVLPFAATAVGVPAPAIQWERNTDRGGATYDEVALGNASVADGGHLYRAVATNDYGSATSNSALARVSIIGATGVDSTIVSLPGWELGGAVTDADFWLRVPSHVLDKMKRSDYADIAVTDIADARIPLIGRTVAKVASNRATSYAMSNKVLIHGSQLFFTYNKLRQLGGGSEYSGVAEGSACIVRYDTATNEYDESVFDHQLRDNHGGFTLWFDSSGRLNALGGGHNDNASHYRATTIFGIDLELVDANINDAFQEGEYWVNGLTYPNVHPGPSNHASAVFRWWIHRLDTPGWTNPANYHAPVAAFCHFNGASWETPQAIVIQNDDASPPDGWMISYDNFGIMASDGKFFLFATNFSTDNATGSPGEGGAFLYTEDVDCAAPSWKKAGGASVPVPAQFDDCTKIGDYTIANDAYCQMVGSDESGNVYVMTSMRQGDRTGHVEFHRVNSASVTLMGSFDSGMVTPGVAATIVEGTIVVAVCDWTSATGINEVYLSPNYGADWDGPFEASGIAGIGALAKQRMGGDEPTFPVPFGYPSGYSYGVVMNNFVEFKGVEADGTVAPIFSCALEVWLRLRADLAATDNQVKLITGHDDAAGEELPADEAQLDALWTFGDTDLDTTTLDLADKSSNGADLTEIGEVYKTLGINAWGLDTWATGNSFLRFDASKLAFGTSAFSVRLAVRMNSDTGATQTLFCDRDIRNPSTGQTAAGVIIFYHKATDTFRVAAGSTVGDSITISAAAPVMFDGAFHTIEFVRDGAVGTLYVDGEAVASSSSFTTGDMTNPSSYGALGDGVYSDTGDAHPSYPHADIDLALVECVIGKADSADEALLWSRSLLDPWISPAAVDIPRAYYYGMTRRG